MSRATGRHTRPKKLTPKQNVQIFRESEVDQIDYDAATRSTIETGVEKAEESEYHLQQAINASQSGIAAKVKDAYIPTPPTIASSVQYDILYPRKFQQPATYIRSSATVEDCGGTPYCMEEEDEVALKRINTTLPEGIRKCSEDHFEEVMYFFEETAQNKQPFASVGGAPVLPLEELEEQFDETIGQHTRTYAKFVYEHWKSRRIATGNRGLQPRLKFEAGQDTDDADPYVCFRRRELRQIRKTRNRDAQSAEKLRRMRKELEDARHILAMVKQREMTRKEVLNTDRILFKQRQEVKEVKRKLGIKGDDDDLVNQKPKKKVADLSSSQQALAQQFRYPLARGGAGDDLRTLEDVQAEKDKAINREIQQNVEKHIRWNEGYVDKTAAPLTPVTSKPDGGYRQAMSATEYLPTPPASVSDEGSPNDLAEDEPSPRQPDPSPFRYASPPADDFAVAVPSFRRRVGRGGRMMIDRKMPYRPKVQETESTPERYRFDSDEEDVEEIISADDQDIFHMMMHRAYLYGKARDPEAAQAARRTQIGAGHGSAPPANEASASTQQQMIP